MNTHGIRLYQITIPVFLLSLCNTVFSMGNDSIRSLNEVIVTGSNNATERKELPFNITTIDKKQLEAMGQNQLLSALSLQVPGMFVSERNILGFGVSNGGAGVTKIRGVGNVRANAVLMMMDGQPQFAGIYSHHIADFYETEYVERVEILRGAGSVLYGSNAMGGVVNVITRNATQEGMRTSFSSQYGSYNTWRNSLTNTTRFGKFSSLIALGYDRTDGLIKHFDFKQGSIYAKVGYDMTVNWKMKADYTLMNFIGNDPIYPQLSNPKSTDIYHQNITRGEASLAISNQYATTNGSIRIYYSYGNHYVDDPRHFHSLDDRFGILAYQNFNPWHRATVTVGFDYDTYSGEIPMSGGKQHTEESLTTISRKSITEYAPYITLSQKLFRKKLTLNAGLRMANSNRFGTHWIPQGGFAFHPNNGWSIKGAASMGYRNPSFREMYLYRYANPDLKPESMMNYEVTIGKTFTHYLNIDVTGYYCKGKDMIQTEETQNKNTGRFINKGIEVAAESHPIRQLNLKASYSYLHSSLDNLTAAPKNQYYLGAYWNVLPKFNINAEVKGAGKLYVSDDTPMQNYALFNMRFIYKIFHFMELSATLNNITNTHYTINKGYEMPGFNFSVGFKLSLQCFGAKQG